MTSDPLSRFVIDLHAAACDRLADVECITLPTAGSPTPCAAAVALPKSYAARRRRRYPLVIVLDAAGMAGSVIEMSRLMMDTGEIRECLVVAVETPTTAMAPLPGLAALLADALLGALTQRYRIAVGDISVFAGGDGRAAAALRTLDDARVKVIGGSEAGVPAFVDALRTALSSGREYGRGIPALRRPFWTPALWALSPLLRRLMRAPQTPVARDSLHRLHATALDRDFEVFVSMPRSAGANAHRTYPALVVLDANIEFSTVAEAARRLADAGSIDEVIVIGVGVPRVEGPKAFAFRRFEEFSPPLDGYGCNDDLGHIFRALFASRGEDARVRLGRAPGFLRFLVDDLLPALRDLPIDHAALGLLGHSAGGTLVGYALHQASSPFRDYVGVSPGIAISGNWLLADVPQAQLSTRAACAQFMVGSEEKTNPFNRIAGIPLTRSYVEQLRRHDLQVTYTCFDGETHSSVYPRAVEQALAMAYDNRAVRHNRRAS